MNIIKTNINDISNNLNENKLNLVNRIIEQIQPLFDKEYKNEIKEVKKLKNKISESRIIISNGKVELEKISESVEKRRKEEILLKRIERLVSTGLIENSMKNELIVLLKSFDVMDFDKITEYLNETMKVLSKKLARS